MILETIIPRDGLSFDQNPPLKPPFLRCDREKFVKFLRKSLNQFFEAIYKVCNKGLTDVGIYAVAKFFSNITPFYSNF
ncbi:UNVERIFIED_CONTAM: hypothetical protein BEN50_06200 [Euhalothece sp. KZN 001]